MEQKIHITDDGPKKCDATKKKCKYSDRGHFETMQEAEKEYEKLFFQQPVKKTTQKKQKQEEKDKNTDDNDYLAPLTIKPMVNIEKTIQEEMRMTERIYGTMPSDQVLESLICVMKGSVPKSLPYQSAGYHNADSIMFMKFHDAGFYGKITQQVAKGLAKNIGDGTVLDPMAGKGYFVKAMREQGIKTIGSDDKSWSEVQTDEGIENLDAVDSLKKHGKDITHLMISWPPYESNLDQQLLEVVKNDFPHVQIIYCGEPEGGCTGSEEFWNKVVERQPEHHIPYNSFTGLHDDIFFLRPKTDEEIAIDEDNEW